MTEVSGDATLSPILLSVSVSYSQLRCPIKDRLFGNEIACIITIGSSSWACWGEFGYIWSTTFRWFEQACSNSSALAWSYCSLAPSHRFDSCELCLAILCLAMLYYECVTITLRLPTEEYSQMLNYLIYILKVALLRSCLKNKRTHIVFFFGNRHYLICCWHDVEILALQFTNYGPDWFIHSTLL